MLSAVLRNEPTGLQRNSAATLWRRPSRTCIRARCWTARAVTPCGQMPSRRRSASNVPHFPSGWRTMCELKRAIKKDQIVSFDDVELVNDLDVVKLRREMEERFRPKPSVAA